MSKKWINGKLEVRDEIPRTLNLPHGQGRGREYARDS
jgi:hypothetical protein